MYCKHCGKVITDDSQYCRYCGGKQDSTNLDTHNDDDTTTKNEESPIKIKVYKKKEPIIIDKTAVADKLTACFKELIMIAMTVCIGFVLAIISWAILVGDNKSGEFGRWCTAIILLSVVVRYIVKLAKWVSKNQSKQ